MDDIVMQAMRKWPNVPHCFGWLALDARGAWRMRDERAQQLGLPGDRLTNAALVGFINRNYAQDDKGRWYFQNGPQRVYLNLESTPFIARTDPALGLVLQTGETLAALDEACMTREGALVVRSGDKVAQVDDRDMAELMQALRLDGRPPTDDGLMAWLDAGNGKLSLRWRGQELPVSLLVEDVARHFGFVRTPAP